MRKLKNSALICLILSASIMLTACSTPEEEIVSTESESNITENTAHEVITGEEAKQEFDIIISQLENVENYEYLDLSIIATVPQEGELLEVEMDLQSDFSNKDNPILSLNIDVPFVGDVSLFYTDGYLYSEVLGMKTKEIADISNAYSSYNSVTSAENFNKGEDFILTIDEYGNKQFDFTYTASSGIDLNSITGGFADSLSNDGEITYNTVMVDSQNNIVSMYIHSYSSDNSDEITASVEILFNSLNVPFEINTPDLSQYN